MPTTKHQSTNINVHGLGHNPNFFLHPADEFRDKYYTVRLHGSNVTIFLDRDDVYELMRLLANGLVEDGQGEKDLDPEGVA